MTRNLEIELGYLGEVERALLRHIGQHRFTVPLVLERLFRMDAKQLECLLAPLASWRPRLAAAGRGPCIFSGRAGL